MIELSERVKRISQLLFDQWHKDNQNASFGLYAYTIEGKADDLLSELIGMATKQQRELDILKVQSETWKHCYLEQVKENVRYQAEQLKHEKA